MTVALVAMFGKNISINYALLFAAILVSNLGYLQISSATELSGALFGNQLAYFCTSFIPYLAFICIADLCKVQVPKVFRWLCVAVGTAVYYLVATIGTQDYYYKSVQLVQLEDYSYLEKEYGPLHIVCPIYLMIMTLITLGIVLKAFRQKKKISYITSVSLAVVMILTVATYVVEKALSLKVELMPLAYVLVQLTLLLLLGRISMYDVSGLSVSSMSESMLYGFITFNEKGCFIGADQVARTWFPELNDLKIDYPIKSNDTEFLKQLRKWTFDNSEQHKLFECGSGVIEASHTTLLKKTGIVHVISLRDDTKNQRYLHLVKDFGKRLETQVNEKTERLKQVQDDIIISMASIVENRDSSTGGHIQRTSDIIKIFVAHLMQTGEFGELTEQTAECIIKAAPLHDFGKIAIPDIVLNKPGKYNEDEYGQMKMHSEKGAEIVARILQNSDDMMFKNIAVNIAHYHHEKWNGKGYPAGLSGKSIPFEARIMALADVFDALVSKRVYKERFSYDKAFSIIEESLGEHFDPDLCREFLKCRPQLESLYNSYTD